MEKQFEIFKNSEGDTLTRLRKSGYDLQMSENIQISSLEDFKAVVSRKDCVSKEKLLNDLKKIYKNHMSLEELKKFLRMGSEKEEKGVEDALRILPLNEDGGITVEDFVNYLFK